MSKRNELITAHYRLHYTRLVKTAIHRVPNNSRALAEEVVQEAYARALKYYRTYNHNNDFDKWFNGIFRNALNDCRTIEQERGCTYEYNENLPDLRVDHPLKDKLWDPTMKSIAKLQNERDKQIMVLYYQSGFTSKDISEYMGMKHGTVRQIIIRFKDKVNEAE
jgi:RNA polymerase sigma factor (sigma-70 family)